MINNILVEKENRKGFEKLLKKPTQKFSSIITPINTMDIQSSDNSLYLNYLNGKVPRGLQTKKNVTGLQPIHLSLIRPNQ